MKSLFKQIFQASMQLEDDHDKQNYLTSRATRSEDTVVQVDGISIGSNHSPVLIAGPCAIESREQALITAEEGLLARGAAVSGGRLQTTHRSLQLPGARRGRG